MATRAGLPTIPRATPAAQVREVESIRRRVPKRRRINDELAPSFSEFSRRQNWPDQSAIAKAKSQCQLSSGNDVISCYPTASTKVNQHDWTTFVWNSRRPELTQNNRVNVYLFRADSGEQVLQFLNETNPSNQAGSVQAQVDDAWFGTAGLNWNGSSTPFPFYWVLIDADKTLDGSQIPQSVFTAYQTTYADSVATSLASASSASAASASSASAASASSASAASASKTRNNPSSTGSIQSSNGPAGFPHWAIAVIVVLGFLALLAACIVIFLLLRRRRRRAEHDERRDSMNSASPMIQHPQGGPSSPLLASAAMGRPASVHDERRGVTTRDAPSVLGHDGASTISRSGSANEGPFSGADAAIMADAFRKMLRKPDFAERPVEEGESPENEGKSEMINRELAEEGRDIRSVRSERGYKVETTSDDGADTVQDHRDSR